MPLSMHFRCWWGTRRISFDICILAGFFQCLQHSIGVHQLKAQLTKHARCQLEVQFRLWSRSSKVPAEEPPFAAAATYSTLTVFLTKISLFSLLYPLILIACHVLPHAVTDFLQDVRSKSNIFEKDSKIFTNSKARFCMVFDSEWTSNY